MVGAEPSLCQPWHSQHRAAWWLSPLQKHWQRCPHHRCGSRAAICRPPHKHACRAPHLYLGVSPSTSGGKRQVPGESPKPPPCFLLGVLCSGTAMYLCPVPACIPSCMVLPAPAHPRDLWASHRLPRTSPSWHVSCWVRQAGICPGRQKSPCLHPLASAQAWWGTQLPLPTLPSTEPQVLALSKGVNWQSKHRSVPPRQASCWDF